MNRSLSLALVLGLVALPLAAQQPLQSRLETHAQRDAEEEGGLLSTRSILHTLGGALVGGWVGYVGAQVARSDWDKEHDGSFYQQRSTWAAVGAVVGAVGVHLLGSTEPPRERGPFEVTRKPVGDRDYLPRQEIEESGALTIFELIRSTRPHWLEDRGAKSWSDNQAMTGVVVYLDGANIGGIAATWDLPREILLSARYLDAAAATYRYGHGHEHGAILLSTREDGAR